MYKITLIIANPINSTSRELVRKFDPATMTQAKWSNAWPAVKAEIDALVAASAEGGPNPEPATW